MNKHVFMQKWHDHVFDDWGSTCSADFKRFAADFKKYLESNNYQVVKHSCGHYDFSGFIKLEGRMIYYSYSWMRLLPFDAYADDVMNGFLIRTAQSENDYSGGINHFVSFVDFADAVKRLH